MNHAQLMSSKRLQRVLQYMADGKEHTTMDIIHGAKVCAVNSIVSELRRNGIAVTVRRDRGVFFYRLGQEKGGKQ